MRSYSKQLLIDSFKFMGALLLLGLLVVFLSGCHCVRERPGPTAPDAPNVPLTTAPLPEPTAVPPQPKPPKPPQPQPPAPEPPSHEPQPKPTPTPLPTPPVPGCLCHNNKVTLCDLSDGARAAHLAHGDYVGQCR